MSDNVCFFRCDPCDETIAVTWTIMRAEGLLFGGSLALIDPQEEWEDVTDEVDVVVNQGGDSVITDREMALHPAAAEGDPVQLPPPGCPFCERAMRRVVSTFDSRDWEDQFA